MLAGQVSAQSRVSAFVEYAEPLRFATATRVLGVRLEALTVGGATEQDEADGDEAGKEAEDEEGPPVSLLALFAGSLAEADPSLLQALEADLADVHRLAKAGDGDTALVGAVDRTQRRLARVREVLIPEAVDSDRVFQAALMAKLAISERGLGEAYEEAAGGEADAYPLAWLLLQRVDGLWAGLKPALPAASVGVERALEELRVLMPSLQPPEIFRDPEDAESAALDMVFIMERALERPLMIRGFKPALALMQRQVQDACAAAEAGRPPLALERALAARLIYQAHLGATLATLAPKVHGNMTGLWGELDTLATGEGGATCAALVEATKRAADTFS